MEAWEVRWHNEVQWVITETAELHLVRAISMRLTWICGSTHADGWCTYRVYLQIFQTAFVKFYAKNMSNVHMMHATADGVALPPSARAARESPQP